MQACWAKMATATAFSSAENIASAYGQFRHITYTLENSLFKIYVNGQFVKQLYGTNVDFSVPNQRNMYIGVQYNGVPYNLGGACLNYWGHLNGVIDELRLYNRALSATEVTQLLQ
jgi:hypothetical protein